MRELSLFSGAGGGLLGTTLLGWKHIGYVEFNDYCQRVIRQRIIDGILDNAPIFGDIRTFISEGYAASYTGMVDVITGGFPCQPFSQAGKRRGADDERNMWPATIECIRLVRPRYALLENVPGLLTSGYFGTVLGDLAAAGYDCRWSVVSAAECGAPHRRERLWIVAHAKSEQNRRIQQPRIFAHLGASREDVANTISKQSERRCNRPEWRQWSQSEITQDGGQGNGFTDGWWAVEPDVGRVAHGVASRVDRLKALGNGQVPAVARAAWELLTCEN